MHDIELSSRFPNWNCPHAKMDFVLTQSVAIMRLYDSMLSQVGEFDKIQ